MSDELATRVAALEEQMALLMREREELRVSNERSRKKLIEQMREMGVLEELEEVP